MLPDLEPGSMLRIVKVDADGGHAHGEVWSRKPTGVPPSVNRVIVRVEKETVLIVWQTKCAPGSLVDISIQFSKDRGRSWNGLTSGLHGNEYRTARADLPSGTLLFRVLAHDGFYTSSSTSKSVRLAPRPPI